MPSVVLGWRFIKDGRHSGATWCCHCWDRMEVMENQQGGVNRVHSPSQGFPTQVLFPSLSTFFVGKGRTWVWLYRRLCVKVRGYYWQSALPFCQVGSRDQTQAVALVTEPWYCSSHKKPTGNACGASIPQVLCCLSDDQESNPICNILNAASRDWCSCLCP